MTERSPVNSTGYKIAEGDVIRWRDKFYHLLHYCSGSTGRVLLIRVEEQEEAPQRYREVGMTLPVQGHVIEAEACYEGRF